MCLQIAPYSWVSYVSALQEQPAPFLQPKIMFGIGDQGDLMSLPLLRGPSAICLMFVLLSVQSCPGIVATLWQSGQDGSLATWVVLGYGFKASSLELWKES